MHSSRSARLGELRRALERRLGQELAEQHDVGLAAGARSRTAARRVRQPREHAAERRPLAARQARARRDRAVHLDELPRARLAVQHVDVLRDDRVQQPAALELGQRAVRAVGLLVAERLEAVAVEAPEALRDRRARRRCARPPSGRRSPRCPCRACGSRGSRRAPRSRRRSARRPTRRERTSSARAATAARSEAGYFPLHCGVRLPRNAPIPSRASAVAKISRRRPSRPRCPRRGRRRRPSCA